MQKPLFYDEANLKLDLLHGQGLYRAFNITIELDTVRRQDGSDEQSIRFKEALHNLR
jgi:hypothetical protein